MGKIDGVVIKCDDCGVRKIIAANEEYLLIGTYLCTSCGQMMVTDVIETEKKNG